MNLLNLTIFTLLSLTALGQSKTDMEEVLTLSMELPKLEKYYDQSHPVIIDNGLINNNLNIFYKKKKVNIYTKEILFNLGYSNHIEFIKFELNENKAELEFLYNYEGVNVSIEFMKNANSWTIIKSELREGKK